MASFLDSIFGSKPETIPYTPTDLGASELQAIMDNIDAWPQIENLGGLFENYMLNAFDTSGFDLGSILRQGGMETQTELSQADPLLHGKIPQDVIDQIQRSSAFTNLLSGSSGSPMGEANTARNLGLTSLDLINQGAGLVSSAGQSARTFGGLASGLIMSPSGMMVTPQQQAALTMQNNLYNQATKQLQANIAAAPDPALNALNQWVEQVGGTILSSYATGGMSKGGNFKTSDQFNTGAPTSWGSNVSQGSGSGSGFNFDTGAPVTTAAEDYGNVFNQGYGYYPSMNLGTNPFESGTTDLWAGTYSGG